MEIVSVLVKNLFEAFALTANAGWLSPSRHQRIVRCGLFLMLAGTLNLDAFGQITYYVAANGSDSNDGRSVGTPFQSISRVNSLSLQAGDQVLFRRGDTFRGSLTVRRSGYSRQPIIFDVYGSGAKPVLAGSVPVTNWSSLGNNLWQATCGACGNRVTGLYGGSSPLPLGRYPNYSDANKGYLTIQSHQGKSQLTSQQGIPLNLNTGWAGAEVVVRATQWITDRYNLTGQSGNSLNLSGNPSNYNIEDNWGFFVQNHPATLDQAGEWAFETNSKTIRLYSTTNPNSQLITATAQSKTVDLSNVANVVLRSLQISESLNAGLFVSNGYNLSFSGVEVINSGEDGIAITGSGANIILEYSIVQNANNNGVLIDPYQNVVIRNNIVRRIGISPGRGKSADGQYIGVLSSVSQGLLMENNVVDEIGYNAISFTTGTTLRRNVVSNFCLTKSDGGGIYTWNGNQDHNGAISIQANIVSNSIGAPEGTPGGAYSGANGIYMDDCTQNAQITGNTVFNCNGFGIYLHATTNATLNSNTVYNNTEAQLAILPAGGCAARSNTITNNILVSRVPDQLVGKYESNSNDIAQYGNFDYNYYVRPFEDMAKIRVIYNNGGYTGGHYSLAEWQSLYGKDANSKDSPITYPSTESPDNNIRLVYNPTIQNSVVSLNGNYRDAKNQAYSGSVTLGPFTSLLLLKENSTTPPPPTALRDPENPANAVSGLDYRYYEGNWTSLPDFNAITPVKTGTASIPDISMRNRDDFIGLRFTGYVEVPTDGTYTFYSSSDDGSKLFIGSTEVVNHDGTHPATEKSGSIGLKAGRHALTIVYFENNGGEGLNISYSGPNLGKQTIPAAAFYRVGTTTPPPAVTGGGSGLRAEYYNNTSLGGSPALSRVDATVNFEWGNDAPAAGTIGADNYSVRWSGQVEAPVTGSYTFSTLSDDGVRLWVNGVLLINNWGDHAPTTNTGSISLSGGQRYDIRMEYYEAASGAVARLSWSYAGQGDQVVPQGRLYPAGGGARRGVVSAERGSGDGGLLVYPVPARDQTTLEYYSTAGGVVELSLVNGLGQVVYRSAERVVVGTNRLLLGVGSYARGQYVLRVVAGSRSISRKIILTE